MRPVARPTKLSCAPTNYQAHIAEMRTASAQPGSQVVTRAVVENPRSRNVPQIQFVADRAVAKTFRCGFRERRNDHEVELVMVIGKTGSDIPQRSALDHVACYCLGLDMTVRGREDRSFRKSRRRLCGRRALDGDRRRDARSRRDAALARGQWRGASRTAIPAMLIYNCRRLIEFASSFYTLYPGDLIYTGTPEGVGPVKPGDTIVCRSSPVLGELKIGVRAHDQS